MYGTSGAAIRYFGTWLNELRHGGLLPVRSEFLEGADVHLKEGGRIRQALKCGDAVVVHVWQKEVGHYILLTGLQKDTVCAFDPYFQYQGAADYAVDPPDPFACNVCIPLEILDSFNRYTYAMGETDTREALVIGREAVEMLYII